MLSRKLWCVSCSEQTQNQGTHLRALTIDFLNWLDAVIYTIGFMAELKMMKAVPSRNITAWSSSCLATGVCSL